MKSFFTPGKVRFENRFNSYAVVYFSVIIGIIMLFCISLRIGIFKVILLNIFHLLVRDSYIYYVDVS